MEYVPGSSIFCEFRHLGHFGLARGAAAPSSCPPHPGGLPDRQQSDQGYYGERTEAQNAPDDQDIRFNVGEVKREAQSE